MLVTPVLAAANGSIWVGPQDGLEQVEGRTNYDLP